MFWGFIVALASMIMTTIFYVTDNMMSSVKGIIEIAFYVAGIVLCTLAFKKTLEEDEPFPYSRALGLGVATMLFASIILAVFNFVLFKFIDPNLIEETLQLTANTLMDKGFDEDMVAQQIDLQRKFTTPAILSLGAVFGGVLYGLIISLVTSIFLQKKDKDSFSAAMNEIDDEE